IQGATNRLYTATQAGPYRVVLTNASGCKDTSRIITITTVSTPDVNRIDDQSVCNGSNSAAITFSGSVTGTLYDWANNNSSIGLPVSGTGNIGVFKAINTGAFPVTATITVTPRYTNAGITCTGTPRTFTITVNPTPVASITPPITTIICDGSSVTLTATGGSTYQWFLNGSPINGVSGSTYAATQPGAYTVVPTSATNCKGQTSSAINLSMIKRPTADFSFSKTCAGFATNFTNLSQTSNSGTVGYAWTFGNGGGSGQTAPSVTYSQPGSYTVTLLATPTACPLLTSTVSKTVSIQAAPANIRYPIKEASENRDLLLESRSFSGATYQWIPPTGLNNPNIQNPV
ncbi:MAG: PKD domain-containing protein, partial [Bacteroidota bacterium]